MCYLIAKNVQREGCVAHGKHLVEIKRELNAFVAEKGVQLVTISRPTAYGEYAPYSFAENEKDFFDSVKKMV